MTLLPRCARFFRACFRPASPARSAASARASLTMEILEDRTVPSGFGFRSFDGTGNNLAHAVWGSAGVDFLRRAAAEYWDGASSIGGQDRPGARQISNVLVDQGEEDIISPRLMSAMVYAWGQFIDHDMDLAKTGTEEELRIPVPQGDPFFDPNGTGNVFIVTHRSVFDPSTGTGAANPRQQINAITAWLDGSMIYGSDAANAATLRTFAQGRMKTTAGGLLPMDAAGNFLAGDERVNENPELTSLQTLFVREHNWWAARIAAATPGLSDEQLYQRARERVIAELQAITFNQWLPTVLGQGALPRYQGYNPNVNPGIANEFATAGFRFGHSLLGDDIEFLDNQGNEVHEEVALRDAFNNPGLVRETNVGPILKYLASDPSSELDNMIVGGVRNFLFGQPGQGGFDLASLNIARGRDHGLADYNAVRQAYGLPRVTTFAQISSDPSVQARLQQLYGSVDNIDLWVGALSENHVQGASVGPTIRAILADQFSRLRDGDRFWYERNFSGSALREIQDTELDDIIRRNTTISNLQRDVFTFDSSISGTLFSDLNRNGRKDRFEPTVSGRSVALVNADGEIVATAVSGPQGRYRFGVLEGLRTGRYRIALVQPGGSVAPPRPGEQFLSITKGDQALDFDLAVPPPH